MKLEQLNEVFVIGDKKNLEGKEVVAYKQWIWVGDYNDQDIIDDINSKTRFDVGNMNDFSSITERNPHVIFGYITGDSLFMHNVLRHSSASQTLIKVLKALGLRSITVSLDDSEYTEYRHDFLLPLKKKTFYHGTDLVSMKDIRKIGIKPIASLTNFININHEDKVFMTLNKENTEFHAKNAAENHGSFPVVLEFNIPDADKLVSDYDIAINYYGKHHDRTIELGYTDIYEFAAKNDHDQYIGSKALSKYLNKAHKGPDRLSTQLGIFGYIGRIPPTMITGLYVDTDQLDQYIYSQDFGDPSIEEILGVISPVNDWQYFSSFKEFDRYYDNRVDDIYAELNMDDEDED